jgi:hypothetical protein
MIPSELSKYLDNAQNAPAGGFESNRLLSPSDAERRAAATDAELDVGDLATT